MPTYEEVKHLFEPAAPREYPQDGAANPAKAVPSLPAVEDNYHMNLSVSRDLNPDQEARVYHKSRDLGMPIGVVREADSLDDTATPTDISQLPALKGYIGESVNNAAISKDDLGPLSYIEQVWKKAKASYSIGTTNVELGKLRTRQMFGDNSPELQQRIDYLKKNTPSPVYDENYFEKVVTGASEQIPLLLSSLVRGQKEGIKYALSFGTLAALYGQAGPQALTPEELVTVPAAAAVGYGAGTAIGAATGMFQLEAGLAYDEFLEIRDENGRPIDKNILRVAAVGVGATNAALEFVSVEKLLKTVPGGERLIGKLTIEPVKQMLKVPGVRQALAKVAAKYAEAIATEAITEMAQEAVTVLAGEFAKAVAESTDGQYYFPPINKPEAIGRVLEAGTEAIAATIGMGFPGSVVGTVKAIRDSNHSQKFIDTQGEINQAVNQSATKERSPEHMEKFLDGVGLGEDVFITPEGIKTLYQTDQDAADGILTSIGVDPKTARDSAALGVDVSAKMSKIHAYLTPEQFEAIKLDLKPAPGAYSAREIQNNNVLEEMDRLSAIYSEAVQDEEGFRTELDRLHEATIKAGYSNEYADTYTQVLERFANRMALEGQNRVDFLKKVEIARPGKGAAEGQVFYQTATSPLGFYSATQQAVEGMDFKTIPAKDLANRIKKAQGIKQEELDWIGLTEWLEGMGKDKVTKEQVQAFIEQGGVKVEEVRKGAGTISEESQGDILDADEDLARMEASDKEVRDRVKNHLQSLGVDTNEAENMIEVMGWKWNENEGATGEAFERAYQLDPDYDWNVLVDSADIVKEARVELEEQKRLARQEPTKYQSYTLSGGENYREVLLTLPLPSNERQMQKLQDKLDIIIETEGSASGPDAVKILREMDKIKQQPFKSPHFDEPNILAHIRLNDRVDSEGRKTLFIEEIQSDWHQKGRKSGYKDDNTRIVAAEKALADAGLMAQYNGVNWIIKNKDGTDYQENKLAGTKTSTVFAANKGQAIAMALGRREFMPPTHPVPDAPFKTSWPLLVFKRVLRMAAEEGYNAVAWTPGEVQNERYKLSNQINELKVFVRGDGTYDLSAKKAEDGRSWDIASHLPEKKLSDYIGKELAERIIKGEGKQDNVTGRWRTFSGLDLEVGGEGMKGFYDKMLPSIVEKYVKKLDKKTKVEEVEVKTPVPGFPDFTKDRSAKAWSLPLTEKLKQEVLAGQTLFQAQEGQPRGAVSITDEKYLVSLFEGKNLSTLLHETAHIFLSEIDALVGGGDASDELQKDYRIIRDWLGVREGQAFETAHQEQFARGFEAYLMEGKAPTLELEGAFARFRRWLTEVYKSVKALNVPLNNSIRGVFDRMLTARTEIATSAQMNGFAPKTTEEMNALGILPEDQGYMKRLIKIALEKAENKMVRDRNKSYRANKKNWRVEAKDQVENTPIYQAIDYLTTGPGLDRDELELVYGQDIVSKMPDPRVVGHRDIMKSAMLLMLDQLYVAEKGQRIFLEADKGGAPDVKGFKSTYPGWYPKRTIKGGKYTVIKALTRMLDGQHPKTVLEKELFDTAQGKGAELVEEIRSRPVKVVTGDANLQEGDAVYIKHDRFMVTGVTDEAVTLSHPEAGTVTLDPFFDEIAIDGGLEGIERANINTARPSGLGATALSLGYDGADELVTELTNAMPKYEAINKLVADLEYAHDQKFKAEDYLVSTKEYAEYLMILSKYLSGSQIQEAGADISTETTTGKPKAPKTISRQMFTAFARKTLSQMSVKDAIRSDRFLSYMKKAANEERKASLAKNYGKAAKANEQVRLNYEMAGQAVKNRREVEKIINQAKRAGKSKTISIQHRENIRSLIQRFGLADNIAPQKPAEMRPLSKLIEGDGELNTGFPASDFLLNNMVKDYRYLSMDQIKELGNLIDYLAARGRDEHNAYLSDGKTRVEDAAAAIVSESSGLDTKKVHERFGLLRKMSDITRSAFAMLDSLQFISIAMGGYQNIGKKGVKSLAETLIFDPLVAAQNKQTVMFDEVYAKLEPHLIRVQKSIDAMARRLGKRMIIKDTLVPERLQEDGQHGWWSADQVFAIALNQGNEGNRQKLIAGYAFTQDTIDRLLNLLSKEDWDAVQGIWDVIDSLYPETNAVHVKINNFHMDKVEASPVQTRYGVYKGGYYPLRYDPKLSINVAEFTEADDILARSEAIRQVPASKSGFTKSRVGGVHLPVKLSLNVATEHIRDTVHYITHAQALKDVDRIIRNENFAHEAQRVLGSQVYDMMRPALKHIARPDRWATEGHENKAIEWARGKTTAFVLAWNTGVALKQVFSTPGAVFDLGARAYINGFASVLANPASSYQTMTELSPYMAQRAKNMDRELHAMFAKMKPDQKRLWFGDKAVTWKDVVNFGFWPIRLADMLTVMPIWNGAFKKGLAENNGDTNRAVDYADNIVRKSQPSAQPLDLSHWQRVGGGIRLFSSFQTFTVGKYGQRQRLHYRAWKAGKMSASQYAWFNFCDAVLPAMGMSTMMAFLWGQDLEDRDTWFDIAKDTLKYIFLTGVPIVGNLFSPYSNLFDSPLNTGAEEIKKAINNAAEYIEDFDEDTLQEIGWNLVGFASYLSGVPTSRIIDRAYKGAEQYQENIPGIKYLIPAPKNRR